MQRLLNSGTWSRPTDKTAVYLEIKPGKIWGIRVTIFPHTARVEAVNGPKCTWYKAPIRFSKEVTPPNFLERLQGITFEEKLMEEVSDKRKVAAEENAKLESTRDYLNA
ncbi:MAG: hypothetical protein GX316_00955 [Firmicutes bacterium]|nr:hypothetical protein [Bacillota bacterium]